MVDSLIFAINYLFTTNSISELLFWIRKIEPGLLINEVPTGLWHGLCGFENLVIVAKMKLFQTQKQHLHGDCSKHVLIRGRNR